MNSSQNSRQNLPQLQGSSVEKVLQGGYVLQEAANAQITLVATGSEVSLAVDTAQLLQQQGVIARVVSMPCTDLFDLQSVEYKTSVLAPGIPTLSIEALSTFGKGDD